ncbi:integrase, catalytic region, zinc finger, CCHC-type containing protein [Tanacetum coccineum]
MAVHQGYLKFAKDHVATLHKLLEHARALKPLDENLDYACKFAQRIQELLVYVSASCPFTQSGNEKWALATRRVSYTYAIGSQPKSNTSNDMIQRPLSRSEKNKVEVQLRKFKSILNKNNHVSYCNANVKNVVVSLNSKNVCLSVVATVCYTQNRSLIYTRYNKTPYELLRIRKPDLKFLYVFSALCYPTNDSEDLEKLKPKANIGIFIGYSPSKKAYQIYNKRTRLIMETIHVQFDELTQMASEQLSSGPEPQPFTSGQIILQTLTNRCFYATLPPQDTVGASSTTIDQDASSPSTSPKTETTTTLNQSTNVEETNNENKDAEFESDTFTNPFAPLATCSAESSSRIVDTSNMHTFQQPQTCIRRWTKDHPLVTIIDNPSKPVSTRRQLAIDAMWRYFHAFLTKVRPKNYKESMKESS